MRSNQNFITTKSNNYKKDLCDIKNVIYLAKIHHLCQFSHNLISKIIKQTKFKKKIIINFLN